jgi:hypothetical protein
MVEVLVGQIFYKYKSSPKSLCITNMATYTKNLLSGSVNGKQILITATTSASANPIHTSVAGETSLDEIWLYAYNEATASILLSIDWGSTVEPNSVNRATIPSQSGRTLIVDGKLLQNGLIVSAYATTGSFISIDGFINRLSP